MKFKEIMEQAKKEIKTEVKDSMKGFSAITTIAGWIIGAFLVIGLFTGTLQNVVDNLFLKHYYIYSVKMMDSPEGVGTLKDYVNANFADIKWDFEREEDEKVVSVSGILEGNRWELDYSIADGMITPKAVLVDGESLLGDGTMFPIENEYEEEYEPVVEEPIEQPVIVDQKPAEVSMEYFININDKIKGVPLDDLEAFKEIILESKFEQSKKSVGDCLDKYLDDVEYQIYQTEKGTSLVVKGFSSKDGQDLNISLLLSYGGDLSILSIRSGINNSMMDMETQLKIAGNIFNK